MCNFLAIGRTLIPRYFRSIFEGGVTELYFHLKLAKESFQNTIVTLDCEQCTMVTHHHAKPTFSKVSEVSYFQKYQKNLRSNFHSIEYHVSCLNNCYNCN